MEAYVIVFSLLTATLLGALIYAMHRRADRGDVSLLAALSALAGTGAVTGAVV